MIPTPHGATLRVHTLRYSLLRTQNHERVPLFKPGVGQTVAFCATPAARNSAFSNFCLLSLFTFKALFRHTMMLVACHASF